MYTILICDDDKDIVSALDIYLTSEGYRTIKAYNGREAIRAVEQNEIHLILMDIMMPNLNGWDTARRIRSMKRSDAERVPVIAMSANAFAEDIRKSKEAGMNAHISKPIQLDKMVCVIAGLVHESR